MDNQPDYTEYKPPPNTAPSKIAIWWISINGILLIARMLYYFNRGGMFDPLLTLAIAVVFCIVLLIVWANGVGARKRGEGPRFRKALRIGLCFLLTAVILRGASEWRSFRPQRYTCVCPMIDFNGYSLTLYKNGNYKWRNWVFGMANYQWGHYSLHGDTVLLDVDSLENIVSTDKILITKMPPLYDSTEPPEDVCVQLCQPGKWGETMRLERP